MISASYPFWLNAIAFVSVTIPVLLLLIVYKMSGFKVWKYILCGVLGFFIADRILAPFFYAFTESMALGENTDNPVFFRYIAPLFYSVFEFLAFFVTERFILKKNLKVTEIVALPVMFYIFPVFEGAFSYPSLAKCAKHFTEGTLGELVTGSLTMDDLMAYVEMIQSPDFWPTVFCQILNRFVIIFVLGAAVILIYHGMMKHKALNYVLAFLVIIGNYELISLIEQYAGLKILNIYLSVLLVGLGFFFVKYFSWYFNQKKEYQKQLADYREHLKRN